MKTLKSSRLLKTLMTTTALGGALAVAAPAMAADECGAPVNGVVTCAATGTPYGQISYDNDDGVEIYLQPGVQASGVSTGGTGDTLIRAADGTLISSTGKAIWVDGGRSAVVRADQVVTSGGVGVGVAVDVAGDIDIDVDTVTNTGGAYGIYARGGGATLSVKADEVRHMSPGGGAGVSAWGSTAEGSTLSIDIGSLAVSAPNTPTNGVDGVDVATGDIVSVKVGTLNAEGFEAAGVRVGSVGAIDIDIGSLAIAGTNAFGVAFGSTAAQGGSFTFVESARIAVDDLDVGFGAVGLFVRGNAYGDAEWGFDLDIGSIHGAGAGIDTVGNGSMRLVVDEIDTSGFGIQADRYGGALSITAGRVATLRDDATAIRVVNRENVYIDSTQIETQGDQSAGIDVEVDGGTTVVIDSSSIVTGGENAAAIKVYGDEGARSAATVDIASGGIVTSGDYSYGVYVRSENVTAVSSNTIHTAGEGAYGMYIDSTGPVLIESGTVETVGDDAPGIYVENASEVSIASAEVSTSGVRSAGISVNGVERIEIGSGSITTEGAESHGLLVTYGGDATIKADVITTAGDAAAGLWAHDLSDVTLDLGQITTTGRQGYGVLLRENASVTGRIDNIRTEGYEAAGLLVSAQSIDLEFGSIETFGDSASGIEAVSEDGLVRLRGDSIVTHGTNARGVEFASVMGGVLEIGSVHTYGAGSDGVSASVGENISFAPSASSLLTLDIGQVVTEGEGAFGVNLNNNLGEISGHIETIETLGEYSHGLFIDQDLGSTTDLTLGSVKTHGEESFGLVLGVDGGDLVVSAREVTTGGDGAHGVLLEMSEGVAEVAIETIVTQGDNAFGLGAAGNEGEALVRANSVTTFGAGSYGVVLYGRDAIRMTAEVGAVTTSGDGATAVTTGVNNSEAVTVKAGTITTSGADANGLYLYAQDLTLDIGRIATTGGGSTGAFLTNYGGDDEITTLRGRIGAIDTSGHEASGLIVQHTGRFDLEVGATHTRGDDANGITVFAAGSSEAGGKLVAGSVLTEGYESIGVDLYTEYGGYDVAVQSIETRGDYSTGLDLRGGETSTIQLGTVRTSGEHADGVYASLYGLDSDLTVSADDIRTTGVNAYGLRARAEADMTLNLGYVDAAGSESDAVVAESGGALTLSASRRLGSASGVAADLTGATIDVTLASTAVVEGGSAGLVLASQDGATIRNAGSMSSANGFAIEAETGRVTLDNSGLVTGRISFASEDDVVNNSGRFAAALTNNFGGGDDVFNNTGVLSLADPTATTPRTATFAGLERLNNAGVIDLANGVAGDVLTISGVLNGQAGNSVELDLDARGAPVADRIVAGGFEGLTNILLTVQGRASLGDAGVVVAQSGSAQTGAEIAVEVAGGGFVDFDLTFANGEYRLNGDLAPPAFEPTKVATGAQHQWTSGADVVSARFDQMRDAGGRAEGRGDQVWAQVYGGSNDIEAKRSFDLLGETLDADLSHEVKSQGLQAGVDRAVPVDNGALVFGMLAGAGKTELRFQNGDVTEYDGVGVGAYGHWFSGPLSIGVLAKLDTFKLDYDWAEANLKTRSDGFTVGARVDAAWRIAMGPAWHVEPQASISWSDTALGRMKARDGAEVVFGDTRSMVGRIGVRAGAEMTVGDGLSFKPFAAVHALNEFEGDNASTLILGDEAVGVADRAHGAWGRAVLGASLDAPSGLGGFIQAEGDFGEVEGFTARAGVKFSW